MTVNEAPSFTSASSTTFTTSTASSYDFTTGGWPLPSFTVTGTLPSGIAFHDNGDGTGTLSGTPAAGTGGVYTVTVKASNLVTDATETFTLTIDQPTAINTASRAAFVIGEHGSFSVATSGYPSASLSVIGALPTGIAFHDNGDGSGTLSGTPAAGTSGVYDLAVTAHNGVGTDSTQNFTLTINQVPTCTSADSVTFTAGRAGAFEISCFGYPSPSISVTGALPDGLTSTDNGNGTATLMGTPGPGTGGKHIVTISSDNGVGSAATQTLTITVDEAPSFSSTASATLTVGDAENFTITTTGYPDASITEIGDVPSGMTCRDNGDGTASISGTPSVGTGGVYPVVVSAGNSTASTAQNVTLTVVSMPPLASESIVAGNSSNIDLSEIAGSGAYLSVVHGTLPPGLHLEQSGMLTGKIAKTAHGKFEFVVEAMDGTVMIGSASFEVTVETPFAAAHYRRFIPLHPASKWSFPLPTGRASFTPTVIDTRGDRRYVGVPDTVNPKALTADGATVITGEAAKKRYLNPAGTYIVLKVATSGRISSMHPKR